MRKHTAEIERVRVLTRTAVEANDLAHRRLRIALNEWTAKRRSRTPEILVVDDDPLSAQLLGRWFSGYGVVMVETSAHLALVLMRRKPYDLVVVDMLMPELSGAALIEQVRTSSVHPLVPIIAISGAMHDPNVRQAAELAGATLCFSKPISQGEFGLIVMRLGLRKLQPANGGGNGGGQL